MIHPTAKVSEQVNRKCLLQVWFYNFQPSMRSWSPQTHHLFSHRCWYHLSNTLKHIANKRTTKICTSGIALISMLHGCSWQCMMPSFLFILSQHELVHLMLLLRCEEVQNDDGADFKKFATVSNPLAVNRLISGKLLSHSSLSLLWSS